MSRNGEGRRARPTAPDVAYADRCERLIEPDAQDRPGRQRDVLAFGRGDRAAAADEHAEQRALGAAEDAADDRADARARADLGRPRP